MSEVDVYMFRVDNGTERVWIAYGPDAKLLARGCKSTTKQTVLGRAVHQLHGLGSIPENSLRHIRLTRFKGVARPSEMAATMADIAEKYQAAQKPSARHSVEVVDKDVMWKPQGHATLTQAVPYERIHNMLISALEGGSTYWIESVKRHVEDEDGKNALVNRLVYHSSVPFCGGALIIQTQRSLGSRVRELNIAKCCRGLQLMQEKYPKHFGDLMCENDDAETADVWLQLSLFEEVLYG